MGRGWCVYTMLQSMATGSHAEPLNCTVNPERMPFEFEFADSCLVPPHPRPLCPLPVIELNAI